MPDDVLEMIGTAALLEQLAEESAELAQAALKMARKIRNENPTPKSRADCVANLQEEIADVELCISILPAALNDPAEVGRTMSAKSWLIWPVNWPYIGGRVSPCSPEQRPSVTLSSAGGTLTISALSTVCVSTTIIYALQKLWIC